MGSLARPHLERMPFLPVTVFGFPAAAPAMP
jgi:hypothetical protein